MSVSEKIQKASGALQNGESTYSSCVEKVNAAKQKKQQLVAEAQSLRQEYERTKQVKQQNERRAQECDSGIASIDNAIASLQRQRSNSDDDDNDSYIESQISSLEASRASLQAEKQQCESQIRMCEQLFAQTLSRLNQIKAEFAACEAQLTAVRSTCQSTASKLGQEYNEMMHLASTLEKTARPMNKIASGRFGVNDASQGASWASADAQKANGVANGLSSCMRKLKNLSASLTAQDDSPDHNSGRNSRGYYDER